MNNDCTTGFGWIQVSSYKLQLKWIEKKKLLLRGTDTTAKSTRSVATTSFAPESSLSFQITRNVSPVFLFGACVQNWLRVVNMALGNLMREESEREKRKKKHMS